MRIGGCACGSWNCEFCGGLGRQTRETAWSMPVQTTQIEYKFVSDIKTANRLEAIMAELFNMRREIAALYSKIDSLRIKDDEEKSTRRQDKDGTAHSL